MLNPSTRGLAQAGAAGVGAGRSFGTFGELLQGALPRTEQPFMVTFPLALWSTATFQHRADAATVTVQPEHKQKSARLAALALSRTGLSGGGELFLHSEMPEGKGLASSSADLVATARAVAAAAGVRFAPEDIESLLRPIEPSDGVMYDEIVDFDHRAVRLRERLGTLPTMTIVAQDMGGQVDTVHYNSTTRAYEEVERREYARLLDQVREAIRHADLEAAGQVATRSAELNARRIPNRVLGPLLRICRDTDALGVACAHSGTVLGILLPHADPEVTAKADAARAACASLPGVTTVYRSLGRSEDWSPQCGPSSVAPRAAPTT